jgi:leader peptidase (prepilin peptidase)/N-methyltransferase
LLFLGLFVGIFAGPLRPDVGHWPDNWAGLLAALVMMAGLLAASLIDVEHYYIPLSTVWIGGLATVALAAAFPSQPGHRWLPIGNPVTTAWAIGGGVGLLIAMLLVRLGILPQSFPEGPDDADGPDGSEASGKSKPPPAPVGKGKSHPVAEQSVGVTVGARREVLKETLFLLPVIACGWLAGYLVGEDGVLHERWQSACHAATLGPHLLGLGGSLFGLLIGGVTVWAVRILGTLGFGREAMGMGDVDLLAAAGALLGWGGAVVAFFVAPFFGLLIAITQFVRHGRRELPFGPYLSLGVLVVLMFYDHFVAWLSPSLTMIFSGGQQ